MSGKDYLRFLRLKIGVELEDELEISYAQRCTNIIVHNRVQSSKCFKKG